MSGGPSYTEENGILKITIKPTIKMIIRIMYVGQAVLLAGSMLYSSWLIYENGADFTLIGLFTLVWLFIAYFVFRKMLRRVLYSDTIELSEATLRIIRKQLFDKKTITIPFSDIKQISFHNQAPDAACSPKNDSYDVAGFHFAQTEVDFLIALGKLVVETHKGNHYLGQDITIWDGEELVQRIDVFAGHRFPVRMLN